MRLNIGQRLNIGFGAVMGLLAIVGGAALVQVQGLVAISDKQAEHAADLGVASQAMEQSLLTRMAAKNYLISKKPSDAVLFRTRLADLRSVLVNATAAMQAPARADGVSRINDLIDEYEDAFNEAQISIGVKLEALAEQATVGMATRQQIDAAKHGAADVGDTETALMLSEAGKEMITARLEAYKFATTGDRAFLDSSMGLIGQADTHIASIASTEPDGVVGENVALALAGVRRYAELNEMIREQMDAQNRLVTGTMDRIGPEVAEIGAMITASLIEDNNTVAAQAASSAATTPWIMGGSVVFGIGLAIAISFAIGRSVTRPVQQLTEGARVIAAGDYTQTIAWNSKDELGELATSFNKLAETGREALQGISHSIEDVRSQAGDFAQNSEALADGLSRQKQETTQVASAVEEMACSIREVAHKSAEVTEAARRSGEQAAAGGDVVKTTIEEINGIADEVAQSRDAIMTLGEKGQKIGEIISVINDIADQTNLLALNAAIEAARAGEHGRGFAVVADEVRKLAERTTEATEDVGRSIRDIQSETDAAVKLIELSNQRAGRGVELAQEAGDALGRIVGDSTDLVKLIETIAVAAEQQSGVSTEVARSVDGIRQISEEITETAESSSSGANRLSGSAETLTGLVTRFKI